MLIFGGADFGLDHRGMKAALDEANAEIVALRQSLRTANERTSVLARRCALLERALARRR